MMVESKEGAMTPAWPRQGGVMPRRHRGRRRWPPMGGIASQMALQKTRLRKAGSSGAGEGLNRRGLAGADGGTGPKKAWPPRHFHRRPPGDGPSLRRMKLCDVLRRIIAAFLGDNWASPPKNLSLHSSPSRIPARRLRLAQVRSTPYRATRRACIRLVKAGGAGYDDAASSVPEPTRSWLPLCTCGYARTGPMATRCALLTRST